DLLDVLERLAAAGVAARERADERQVALDELLARAGIAVFVVAAEQLAIGIGRAGRRPPGLHCGLRTRLFRITVISPSPPTWKPRSSRSAIPPSTSRKTGSQPRSIGVSSAIRSCGMRDLLLGDEAVPDDAVARHQAGDLSGSGGAERLVEHDADSPISAGRQV